MINSQEIHQRQFKQAFRGYAKEEVDAFLSALAHEWEVQQDTYRRLREDHEKLRSAYDVLKELENSLHRTLQQAEYSSKDLMENARKKADLMLREAELKVQEQVHLAKSERNLMSQEVEELMRRRDQLLIQMRVFLKSQMEHIGSFERPEIAYMTSMPEMAKHPEPEKPETPEPQPHVPAPWEAMPGEDAPNLIDEIAEEL